MEDVPLATAKSAATATCAIVNRGAPPGNAGNAGNATNLYPVSSMEVNRCDLAMPP